MLDFLKSVLGHKADDPDGFEGFPPEQLAAAALLVEAAALDGAHDDVETAEIERILADEFHLPEDARKRLIEEATIASRASVEWQGFTAAIKEACDHDERVNIVEALWRVVLADGGVHDYESSLIRRVCGLLYVTGRESAEARQRAEAALAQR